MGRIESLLGTPESEATAPWLLRQHRPGDIGWVVARHGALYAEEYGFDAALRGAGGQGRRRVPRKP